MLEVRLYRFDVNIKTLGYYKPYFYPANSGFKRLSDLLADISKNDPYFEFDGVKFVKANGYVVSVDESFEELEFIIAGELYISPLRESRSYKDLKIDTSDFEAKFEVFAPFFAGEKSVYDSFMPHFYASKMTEMSDEFLGNSAFCFAKYLIEKFPDKKEIILEIIKPNMAYFASSKILNDPFGLDEAYEFLCGELKFRDFKPKEIINADTLVTNFDKNVFKHNFEGFNIAVFNDIKVENFIKKLKAKVVNFDTSKDKFNPEIFKSDKELALKIAGEIIFDAYDSGADFLIVNDSEYFDIFDGRSAEITRSANRSLDGFYVLKFDEFVSLCRGEKAETLKSHKLRVTL